MHVVTPHWRQIARQASQSFACVVNQDCLQQLQCFCAKYGSIWRFDIDGNGRHLTCAAPCQSLGQCTQLPRLHTGLSRYGPRDPGPCHLVRHPPCSHPKFSLSYAPTQIDNLGIYPFREKMFMSAYVHLSAAQPPIKQLFVLSS